MGISILLFIIGLAVGSFLNVLAIRYDPDRPIFRAQSLLGRSHCPHCKRTLRWYELVPLISFLVQWGRCRSCGIRLSLQYPLVELITGILFVAVPLKLVALHAFELRVGDASPWFFGMVGIYLMLAATLVFISAVDARLTIIPNQSNLLIAIAGLIVLALTLWLELPDKSFLAHYSWLFGFEDSVIARHIVGMLFGVAFFGVIVFLSRGRGMGMGDVKLAGALGLLFGWPDIALVSFVAFILGGIFGILVLMRGTKTLKSAVPFGPFIAAGALGVFFCGEAIMRWYFTLFP